MATKSDIGADIKAANATLGKLFASGDAAAVTACYTKTAVLMPTGMKPQKGHKAIKAFWAGAMGMGVKKVALRTVSVEAHGTTAVEYGAYTLKGDKGVVLDVGKYVVVWKKEGRSWKLHLDIFNTNNAPAA